MTIEQVRAEMLDILEVMGNINNAISLDVHEAYVSRVYGPQSARLTIYVEDVIDVITEEEQEYSYEAVEAMEEWLDAHAIRGDRWWSNGNEWDFGDFRVDLEYSCEDI